MQSTRRKIRIAYGLALILVVFAALGKIWIGRGRHLLVSNVDSALPADGAVHRLAILQASQGQKLSLEDMKFAGADAVIEPGVDGKVLLEVRSPVEAGTRRVLLIWKKKTTAINVKFAPSVADHFGDGTPDFMRLHLPSDQIAFRAWFTELADTAARLSPQRLPKEIDDCAALLRWCYRNALHAHDEIWLATVPLETLPPLSSATQYTYPNTPLGAELFRVRTGAYSAEDAGNGTFAQFADAKTLWQHNTFLVSRDIRAARTGDLMFFRQLEQNSPYHSMVLTGPAHEWAVYDTGPIGAGPGQVRRVALEDLLHHPDTRWRPLPQNSNFLGVYRWNILREDTR